MASELEDRMAALEAAVQALSDRVRVSEQDASAARILAGGADRDVTQIRDELRADLAVLREQNNRLHNATRSDLADLRREFTDLAQKMDTGFAGVRGQLDATAAGQAQIVTLITQLLDQPGADDSTDD
jgi:chromosome segregation ATPase